MEQLLALMMLVLGFVLVLVFTPLAWRRAREETGGEDAAFARVLAGEIEALEARMAQLQQEYQLLSRRVHGSPEGKAPAPPAPAKEEKREASGSLSEIELYRRVFQAYDAGKSVTEIARELGRGKGEIELILNLRR